MEGVRDGKFLAEPDARGKARPNPMSDPAMMEGMMGSMKGQVAMMVPQSLIMGWINAFFSGYVISMFKVLSSEVKTDVYSETAFPTDAPIQADASSRRGYARSGCQMGLVIVLVLFDIIWLTTCLQFHPG